MSDHKGFWCLLLVWLALSANFHQYLMRAMVNESQCDKNKANQLVLNGLWKTVNNTMVIVENGNVYIVEQFKLTEYIVWPSACCLWNEYEYTDQFELYKNQLVFNMTYITKMNNDFVFQDDELQVYYVRNDTINSFMAIYPTTFISDGVDGYGMSFFLINETVKGYIHTYSECLEHFQLVEK